MFGIVLAAGGATRLRPLTDVLPKTLLAVDGDRSILELTLENLKAAGIDDVAVVTGHCAGTIAALAPQLESRLGVRLQLIPNARFAEWNNAYSLWLARDAFREGALVVNGDTVHPAAVEQRLLAERSRGPLLLAVDDRKRLADEEMKVTLDAAGNLASISKLLDPATADGEYIGVSLVQPEAGPALAAALEATFEHDPSRYYEDGYQRFVDDGGVVAVTPIGDVAWVEVDDLRDLRRARELRCRS